MVGPASLLFPEGPMFLSRRDIVLAAANKDGGAHVDLDKPQKYRKLEASQHKLFRPAAAGQSLTPDSPTLMDYELHGFTVKDAHFCCLRQMAYELLLSEELLGLCGKILQPGLLPTIWPNLYE